MSEPRTIVIEGDGTSFSITIVDEAGDVAGIVIDQEQMRTLHGALADALKWSGEDSAVITFEPVE